MSKTHEFRQCLEWGERMSDEPFWGAVYQKAFPGFVSMSKNRPKHVNVAQYAGIDRWVCLSSGAVLRIDEKKRGQEYTDILLEFVSRDTDNEPGWIEKDLQIDYLAYAFIGSRRCYLFPWQLLRRVWKAFGEDWKQLGYSKADGFSYVEAKNPGYLTFSVAVPIPTLLQKIRASMVIDVAAEMAFIEDEGNHGS